MPTADLMPPREQLLKGVDFVRCERCKGERGDFDTTYDRTGSWTWCNKCHGAGIVPKFQAELLKTLRGKAPE
jgi:DnaJ-class molecular chaperone